MKSNSGRSSAEEPMGIVIATGLRMPKVPQVKAYLWYEIKEKAPAIAVEATGS